jgi:hypothetical protein
MVKIKALFVPFSGIKNMNELHKQNFLATTKVFLYLYYRTMKNTQHRVIYIHKNPNIRRVNSLHWKSPTKNSSTV